VLVKNLDVQETNYLSWSSLEAFHKAHDQIVLGSNINCFQMR